MAKRSDRREVFSFSEDLSYARRIARLLSASIRRISTHHFPDGETLCSIGNRRVDADAILVRRLDHPDTKIVDTLLVADALRRAGARHTTLAVPYFPYLRQDKVFHRGEALSAKVFGGLIGNSFDRVITIDPHLHRIRGLSNAIACRALRLSAADPIGRWMRVNCPDAIVVGPDVESTELVRGVAKAAGAEWIVGRKCRLADRRVRVKFDGLRTTGSAIIVDDIGSSGVTIAAVAEALSSQGLGPIDAVVVHALFAKDAIGRIRRAGVRRVVSCDTVIHATNAIATAPLMARALMRIAS
jgi:ribose-phosphate pyrophosphokinase